MDQSLTTEFMAHEVNSSLQGLSLLLEQIQDICGGEIGEAKDQTVLCQNDMCDKLQSAIDSVAYGKYILHSFMEESRSENTKRNRSFVPYSKADLDSFIKRRMKPRMSGAKIHFEYQCEDFCYKYLYLDYLKFQQIIVNLISNSVKACKENDTISVYIDCKRLEEYSARIQICIKDTGCGMTKEQCDSIYQPFTQFNDKNQEDGMGLGMAIVKKYIADFNGDIHITSAVEVGTQIDIVFDVDGADEKYENQNGNSRQSIVSNEDRKPKPLLEKKILIAEDDELTMEMLCYFIKEMGGVVDKIYDGEELWDVYVDSDEGECAEYALLLVDLNLPELSGREFLERIRKLEKKSKIILNYSR